MLPYNAQDMARSFRTVRANTIQVAEEIPEKSYSHRPAEGCRTVAETLAHIAVTPRFGQQMHGERVTQATFELFAGAMQKLMAEEASLKTKAQIVDALRKNGEEFAAFIETLSDDVLAERVHFPAGMEPPSKTRFEMILAAKEHEMHHRGQLMVVQRQLGIVPHLTRDMQARMAQFQQMQQQKGAAG